MIGGFVRRQKPTKMPKPLSDSSEQREAELALLAALSAELGHPLVPTVVPLKNGASVDLDGFNEDARILCEVYAHIGKTKGAQPAKLAKDILKLLSVERVLGGEWRKVVCLADSQAGSCLRGRSWLAAAVVDFGVEVRIVALSAELREKVSAAQRRQVMVNRLEPGV